MTRSHQTPSRGSGFTLIEVLVVLVIVIILAAILFPVFSRAQESARKTTCGSNLYQLGAALQMYARDFDGRFPPTDNDLRPLMAGYLRDTQVLHCSSDWVPPSAWAGWEGPFSGSYQYRGGRTNTDRADLPLIGEWDFLHSDLAGALAVSGSVKFFKAQTWTPVVRGPRPLPAGLQPPAALTPTPLLNPAPTGPDAGGSPASSEE